MNHIEMKNSTRPRRNIFCLNVFMLDNSQMGLHPVVAKRLNQTPNKELTSQNTRT